MPASDGTTASARFRRVKHDALDLDPGEFQGRDITNGGSFFNEPKVKNIVDNYDPDLMEPIVVAPTAASRPH